MHAIWHYTGLDPRSYGGVERTIFYLNQEFTKLGHEVYVGKTPLSVQPGEKILLFTHGDLVPSVRVLREVRKRVEVKWLHFSHGTTAGRMQACREWLSISAWKGCLKDVLPLQFADGVIAVSERTKMELKKYYRVRKPVRVIRNGVDTKIFQARLGVQRQKHRLVFVGRMGDKVKNTENLLRAAQSVRARVPDFELWLIPGDENFQSDFIASQGALFDRALAEKMAQCAALILPSYYEGDPLVVWEAKSLGLDLILSSRIGDDTDIQRIPEFGPDWIARAITDYFEKKKSPPQYEIREWAVVASEILDFARS